jgi:hypothetical protein
MCGRRVFSAREPREPRLGRTTHATTPARHSRRARHHKLLYTQTCVDGHGGGKNRDRLRPVKPGAASSPPAASSPRSDLRVVAPACVRAGLRWRRRPRSQRWWSPPPPPPPSRSPTRSRRCWTCRPTTSTPGAGRPRGPVCVRRDTAPTPTAKLPFTPLAPPPLPQRLVAAHADQLALPHGPCGLGPGLRPLQQGLVGCAQSRPGRLHPGPASCRDPFPPPPPRQATSSSCALLGPALAGGAGVPHGGLRCGVRGCVFRLDVDVDTAPHVGASAAPVPPEVTRPPPPCSHCRGASGPYGEGSVGAGDGFVTTVHITDQQLEGRPPQARRRARTCARAASAPASEAPGPNSARRSCAG